MSSLFDEARRSLVGLLGQRITEVVANLPFIGLLFLKTEKGYAIRSAADGSLLLETPDLMKVWGLVLDPPPAK